MAERIPVAILAATGSVGQRFVQLLDGHPWFEVVALTGSDRAVGQPYGQVCRWVLPVPMPAWAGQIVVQPTDPQVVTHARLAFSALPAEQARSLEPEFARAGVNPDKHATFQSPLPYPLISEMDFFFGGKKIKGISFARSHPKELKKPQVFFDIVQRVIFPHGPVLEEIQLNKIPYHIPVAYSDRTCHNACCKIVVPSVRGVKIY